MKTVVISAPGEMTVREIETPRPAGGEVLLQMLYVGFCGSDLSTYLGKNPMVQYPRVPGHEISGVITELGEEKTKPWVFSVMELCRSLLQFPGRRF